MSHVDAQWVRGEWIRREGVIRVRRGTMARTSVVGAGCVLALTATVIPGPSAVAATAIGRPDLDKVDTQKVITLEGSRLAGEQLKELQSSRARMQTLIQDAEDEQSRADTPATGGGGASGASFSGGASGAAIASGGPAKGGGSYAATSLSPSATWSSGGSAGSFTWSYPLRAVPSIGPEPDLTATYDSGGVDGRLPHEQPAVLGGRGFDLPPRTWSVPTPRATTTDDGQTDVKDKYDLCWKNDNATLMLNGRPANWSPT